MKTETTKIIGEASCLTRKTTGEPSWLTERITMELEAPPIKEASPIEVLPIDASPVVYSCINFGFS